jgi:hypothetical protein
MKKIIFVLVSVLCTLPGIAQVTFEKSFQQRLDYDGYDVIQTFDSGYVTCGDEWGAYYQWTDSPLTLTKTDKYGNHKWIQQFGQSMQNAGFSLNETQDGGIIACGYSLISGSSQAYLVRTDSAGIRDWDRIYSFPNMECNSTSVLENPDGGYTLSGFIWDNYLNTQSLIIRTDPNGDTLWCSRFSIGNMSAYDYLMNAVIKSTDSGFVVLNPFSWDSLSLTKLDQNGTVLWSKIYAGIPGRAFASTGDSGFIVCGHTTLSGENTGFLLKTDLNGELLWRKDYPGNTKLSSVKTTLDDGFVACGIKTDGYDQCLILRTDPSGNILWTRNFGNDKSAGNALKNTFDTGFIITGSIRKSGTDTTLLYLVKVLDNDTLTGVNHKNTDENSILIYPNPSSGNLSVLFGKDYEDIRIEVSDFYGNTFYQTTCSSVSRTIQLQVPFKTEGIFLIRVSCMDFIKTEKVIFFRAR